MTIEEMIKIKKQIGFTNEMIAEMSGVPLGTVQKIFAGITKNPRWETRQALEMILTGKLSSQKSGTISYQQIVDGTSMPMVGEGSVAYAFVSSQGSYTIDDYYALPDERRAELIDGYLYDMAAPGNVHQSILLSLGVQLSACADAHENCEVIIAPFDVRINRDNKTIVQPDMMVVCDDNKITDRRLEGAPDFIIEILSPSNRFHDLFRKLNLYRFAGVREYWIVDPQNLKVVVYDLEHDALPVNYTFDETIPILISGGECEVDFADIHRRIKKYL